MDSIATHTNYTLKLFVRSGRSFKSSSGALSVSLTAHIQKCQLDSTYLNILDTQNSPFLKFGYELALKNIRLDSASIHSDILFVRIAIQSCADCSIPGTIYVTFKLSLIPRFYSLLHYVKKVKELAWV